MSVDLRFRPLNGFPKPLRHHDQRKKPGQFVDNDEAILYDLSREMDHLGATEAEIGIAVLPSQIRRDGTRPLSAAKFEHPGVTLWAHTETHGEMQWACDRYQYWLENLRAIGMTIKNLRLVDSYGVAEDGEQYRGFHPLPPKASDPSITSRDEAIEFIASFLETTCGRVEADPRLAVRSAQKRAHPDVGGDPAKFRLVMRAKELLGV